MDIFWSELNFWWKRCATGWSLVVGVPFSIGVAYLFVDSVRNSIQGIHFSHQLHVPAQQFYVVPCAIFLTLLVFLLLTVLKAISVLYPLKDDAVPCPLTSTDPSDPAIWPPRPKPPM